jgi:hypothetical protein
VLWQIDVQEQKIGALVYKLNEHKRRRNFFLGFSTSPVDFINAIIASQVRLALTMGPADVRTLKIPLVPGSQSFLCAVQNRPLPLLVLSQQECFGCP